MLLQGNRELKIVLMIEALRQVVLVRCAGPSLPMGGLGAVAAPEQASRKAAGARPASTAVPPLSPRTR